MSISLKGSLEISECSSFLHRQQKAARRRRWIWFGRRERVADADADVDADVDADTEIVMTIRRFLYDELRPFTNDVQRPWSTILKTMKAMWWRRVAGASLSSKESYSLVYKRESAWLI